MGITFRKEQIFRLLPKLRNDETIISSISITDIVFDVYLGKWSYRAIPKVKTWSYFLTIPKQIQMCFILYIECVGPGVKTSIKECNKYGG